MAQQSAAKLRQAWKGLASNTWDNVETKNANVFDVGSPSVSEFLSNVLRTHYRTGQGRLDRVRMEAVLKANNDKGLVWIICHARVLAYEDMWGIFGILEEFDDSQEMYHYLIGLLMDPHAKQFEAKARFTAPSPLYAMRICDLAYNELVRRLLFSHKRGLLPADTAAFLKEVPDRYRSLRQRDPIDERDEHLRRLWEHLNKDSCRKYVAGLRSAMGAVRKSGEMNVQADQAKRILLSMTPYAIRHANRRDAGGNLAEALAMLNNQMPLLTMKEKKKRLELLETPAAALFKQLNQKSPRETGHVAWALLRHAEREKSLHAGMKAFRQAPSDLERLLILRTMEDILGMCQQTDSTGLRKVFAFLETVLDGQETHWAVQAFARSASGR